MNDCFSLSHLGVWTGICACLDDGPLSFEETHEPTGVDVLLLTTIPSAAIQLAEHLLHSTKMPRRYREHILEVTKTVTVMEIAKAAPDKHPHACEITVTNTSTDLEHPVSIKISHMHKSQGLYPNELNIHTPEINIEEITSDAITPPKGTTRIEQEHSSKVERIIRKTPITDDYMFNHRGDNVIDLQFTQPVVSGETYDHQQQREPATTDSVQTLYFRPFHVDGPIEGSSSIKVDVHRQAKSLEQSSAVEERDSTSIASNMSDNGGSVSQAGVRSQRRPLSADGCMITIPDRSSNNQFDSAKIEETKRIDASGGEDPVQEGHNYIITALSQSEETAPTPTTRWICAELNAGPTSQAGMSERAATTASHALSTTEENASCTLKSNRNALVKQNSCTEIRIHEEKQHLNETIGLATSSQEANERQRNPKEATNNGSELRQSQSVPTILDNQRSKKADSSTSADGESYRSNRVGSSPIVVINQNRNGSQGSLEGRKNRRKLTITDIDWFAAFNMKEPTRSKSPHNQVVDVLKEAEIVGGQRHTPSASSRREADHKNLDESKINIDDVFCAKSGEANLKKCSCSACNLSKLSDEERRRQMERNDSNPLRVLVKAVSEQPSSSSSNATPAVDISLDEVFNKASSSIVECEIVREDEGESGINRNVEEESANSSVFGSDAVYLQKMETTPVVKSASLTPHPSSGTNTDHSFLSGKHEQYRASQTIREEKVEICSSECKANTEQRKFERHQTSETDLEPKPLLSEDAPANVKPNSEPSESFNWVVTLVSSSGDQRPHGTGSACTISKTAAKPVPRKPERGKEVTEEPKHLGGQSEDVQLFSSNSNERKTKSSEVSDGKKMEDSPFSSPVLTGKVTSENSRNMMAVEKAVGMKRNSNEEILDDSDSACATSTTGAEAKDNKYEVAMSREVAEIRPDTSPTEFRNRTEHEQRGNDQSPLQAHGHTETSITSSDPEEIHFPHGRTTLVGDILRKPSVLEETPFNTDHLSPKEDVTKAYSQRLSQLKSELGLDQMDFKEATAPEPPPRSKSISANKPVHFYSEPEASNELMTEAMQNISDHEAMIDAVFGEVLDGEVSEQTSLGEGSSLHAFQEPEARYGDRSPKKTENLAKNRSNNNSSNNDPSIPVLEESEVKEYVTVMLDQSMDDAISYASKSLKERANYKDDYLIFTRTSFDKKSGKQRSFEGSKKEKRDPERKKSEDPIMKAVFMSSINNQKLMESVISYPLSQASSRLSSPAVVTSELDKLSEMSGAFVGFRSEAGQNVGADFTYVSNASMMMNDTHSSSDGEFTDDHVIKLVFSQPLERSRLKSMNGMNSSNTHEQMLAVEEPSETPDNSVHCETESRSGSSMDHRHSTADDEMLEVEVLPSHFNIRGSYSMLISKEEEPLGKLLEQLRSRGTSSLDFSVAPKLRRLLFQCIREKAYPVVKGLVSSRAGNLLTDEDVTDMVYTEMSKNRSDEHTNPQGNINFCTAENNVCADEVMSYLQRKGITPAEAHLVHYPPAGGHLSTKRIFSKYMVEFMSAAVDEDELVILAGTTSAYDMLCHCTCEADDIILTSAPTYAASVRNFKARADCRIVAVEMDMMSPKLEPLCYQKTLDEHHSKGEVVRAVLIVNPHNPLGATFPPEEVIQLCNWATSNNLVVFVDESFSSCVFGPSSFKSFLSYRHQVEKPKHVAYMWSLSKDFGIPGLKISVVQTSSSELMTSLSRLELIHPVSALAHDVAVILLSDSDWLRRFHAKKLKKMSAHYEFVTKNLREIGLDFTPAVAGCFIMVDFRKHLRSQTFASELSLFQSLCDRGVMLTPGQHVLALQPGWMRLVFTCTKKELVEGTNRLRTYFNFPPVQDTIEY